MSRFLLFLFVFVTACETPSPGESGTPHDTNSTPTGLTCSGINSACASSFAPVDTATVPEALTASDAGGNVVHVVHVGFMASCCLSFDVAAVLDATTLTAAYTEVGDPCDCMCPYTIEYDVNGVPAGTYTVNAGGVDTTVTVL